MWWALAVALIAFACLGLGAWLAVRKGRSDERVEQAERRRDEAQRQADDMARPMPTKLDRARAALRELQRRGVHLAGIETPVRRAADRRPPRDPEG